MPTVSIVVPLYNAEGLIGETLSSLQRQSLSDWQAVVVNDGSTDESAAAARLVDDDRIRVLDQVNQGVSAARNRGVAESSSDWIAFIDADDLWPAGKLASQIAIAEESNADVVFGPVRLFGEPHRQREYASKPYVLEGNDGVAKMISRNHVPQSTVLVRRESLDHVSGYDESLPIAEDYDLWLRMMLAGSKFVYDPNGLAYYRIVRASHSTNKSGMRAGMRVALQRAAMPTWPLRLRRQLKLVELHWSQRRHERRESRQRPKSNVPAAQPVA